MTRTAAAASTDRPRDVVLVGAGHAHVQVLRSFAMEPPAGCRLTLVVDTPVAVYSGMVPGFVAGQYTAEELEIDALPLARRAGARVVMAPAVGIDPAARRIAVEGRPAVRYDLASFDIGSIVDGLGLPGVRRHAVPTRPIGLFVRRAEALLRAARHSPGGQVRVVVVGGGAGGVELALCLDARLRREGLEPAVTLIESGGRILEGYPDSLADRVERRAAAIGARILTGSRVAEAAAATVRLDDGSEIGHDVLVWVAGATSQPLFRDSGLPVDGRGFVLVRPTLQVEGHDDLWAVGDCATLSEHPDTPKAGVYAVRQGPVLTANLRAALECQPQRGYRPQADFLTLLNRGDGVALGAKWGVSFEGRWVMRLKDWIDRRFMRRFQVLSTDGTPGEALAEMPAMAGGGAMLCGGCAAKLGQDELAAALARLDPPPADDSVVLGLDAADDAAAYRRGEGGELTVVSVDAFRAFTDDPYLVGRVGAVNALSDLWAKGAEPRYALALVTLPETAPGEADPELLVDVLAGARRVLDRHGVTLLGGHTTTGPELAVGFTVEGFARQPLPRLGGLRPGERLLLTKPLGTGVLFHADMRGRARGPWIEAALESMQAPNDVAARLAGEAGAGGVTDVTGFGLAGHLGAMARASGVAASLVLESLPALPGALELLARGERSTAHPGNERGRRGMAIEAGAPAARVELLFDPQTSGGLLFGVRPDRAEATVRALVESGSPGAALVGEVGPLAAGEAAVRVRARW